MNKLAKSLYENSSQYLIILFLILASFNLIAQDSDESEYIESVTIIGSKEDVKDLAGSGAVISNEDLQKAMDTDIQKILTAVPGIYMRTEEGYGLRPNISIRGRGHFRLWKNACEYKNW